MVLKNSCGFHIPIGWPCGNPTQFLASMWNLPTYVFGSNVVFPQGYCGLSTWAIATFWNPRWAIYGWATIHSKNAHIDQPMQCDFPTQLQGNVGFTHTTLQGLCGKPMWFSRGLNYLVPNATSINCNMILLWLLGNISGAEYHEQNRSRTSSCKSRTALP